MKWAGMMMRSKKLQKVMADYVDAVAHCLEHELIGNTGLVRDWVGYPHSNSVSPTRNHLTLT